MYFIFFIDNDIFFCVFSMIWYSVNWLLIPPFRYLFVDMIWCWRMMMMMADDNYGDDDIIIWYLFWCDDGDTICVDFRWYRILWKWLRWYDAIDDSVDFIAQAVRWSILFVCDDDDRVEVCFVTDILIHCEHYSYLCSWLTNILMLWCLFCCLFLSVVIHYWKYDIFLLSGEEAVLIETISKYKLIVIFGDIDLIWWLILLSDILPDDDVCHSMMMMWNVHD